MAKLLRWLLLTLGSLVVLVIIGGVVVYVVSAQRANRTYTISPASILIPNDSATLERGRHLVQAITKCGDCHGDDLGGAVVIDDAAVGRAAGSNLTRSTSGLGGTLSDADWIRAIRHGVGHTGKPIILMPSEVYVGIGNTDLAAVIAYAKSVPPVDRAVAPSHLGPLGRVLYVTGRLPWFAAERIDHNAVHPEPPPAGVTVEYGRYLANIGGCTGCHGPELSGGHVPGTPPAFKPATNITPTGLAKYTEEDFFRALREGKRPGGFNLDPFMPWARTKLMTDDEIRAVWMYLKTVPAKEYGGR